MTIEIMIKELEAARLSVLAHPDQVQDSEFEGTADRISAVIEGLTCYAAHQLEES
jgi:hypothetical protein